MSVGYRKEFEANVYQDPVTAQMLLFIVDRVRSDQLLRHLPAVDQEGHRSRTLPSSCDQPEFYWIFKNMDFEQWQFTNGSKVKALWISGPAERHISDAASHIVDLAKETHSEALHSVLYFFCSTAPTKIPTAISFVSTIVHQLICSLPQLKEKVTTVFLRTLLDIILREEPLSNLELSRFKRDDSVEATVKKILEASSGGYWGALRAVLDIERDRGLSLITDGLDRTEHQNYEFVREVCVFLEDLRGRRSTTRVLLTSRPQATLKEILSELPCIEYDRERKGLIYIISLFLRKTM
jgi:hypothetical protein